MDLSWHSHKGGRTINQLVNPQTTFNAFLCFFAVRAKNTNTIYFGINQTLMFFTFTSMKCFSIFTTTLLSQNLQLHADDKWSRVIDESE